MSCEDNEKLLKVVALMAELGIEMCVRMNNGALTASFSDGFYKSDGLAYLRPDNGRLYLHARYDEKTEIFGPLDIIRCSKEWHDFSHDRFDGWRTPPAHWAALYETLKSTDNHKETQK